MQHLLIYNSLTVTLDHLQKSTALQNLDTLTYYVGLINSDPATICKDSLGLTFIIVFNYQTSNVLLP